MTALEEALSHIESLTSLLAVASNEHTGGVKEWDNAIDRALAFVKATRAPKSAATRAFTPAPKPEPKVKKKRF